MKRHLFKYDCSYELFATGQLIRVATVSRTKKNTASHWEQYINTVLRIGNYLLEQPVVLFFQNFANIYTAS